MNIAWKEEKPIYVWHYDYYLSGSAPDAFTAFDAERVADEIVSTGSNFVAIFALNQHGYAYYPSKIAPIHPSLGDLDYTGSLLEALHKRDATVITYINYMNIERREAHPEWWQRAADGSQVYNDGWGVPCPNGPIREYMSSIVREVAELYPTDGFFFDMYAFSPGGCWCEHCRRKYAEQYDTPFPIAVDWGTESWNKYIDFRYASAIETMTAIRDAAKAVRPELIWVTHCGPESSWTHAVSTLQPVVDDMIQSEVGTRRGQGRWVAGQRSKILRPFSSGQQVVTILADLHLYWDKPKGWFYTPWSVNQTKRQVAEIIAHGAWPDIYTEPFPDGRNDPHTIEGVREAFMMAKQVEPYLLGTDTVKSVALHYCQRSRDFWGKSETINYTHSFEGAYKALLDSHIPFDVIMDKQIVDGSIRQYDLVVLANSACTSDAVNQGLRHYVEGGGSLLATYKTSLYDDYGRKRMDFGLADLFGAGYRADFDGAYIEASGPLAAGLSASPIIEHRLLRVAAGDGAEVLGTVIAPSPTDLAPFRYWSAPTVRTDWPALVRKGRVIYCAGDVSFSFMRAGYPDHVGLIANCVEALVGDKLPLRLRTAGTVDIGFRRQGDRYLVHLVNLVTNQLVEAAECEADSYQVIPLHDLQLEVKLGRPFARAYRATDGSALPVRREVDSTVVTVPKLELYDIVVLE